MAAARLGIRSLQGLGVTIVILFGVHALVSIADIILTIKVQGFLDLLRNALKNPAQADQKALYEGGRDLESIVGWLDYLKWGSVALRVGIVVLLSIWLYRATKNLNTFGIRKQIWKPGMAVGGWFIPLGNIVIPALAGHEAWKLSTTKGRSSGGGWTIFAWWPPFLVAGIAYAVIANSLSKGNMGVVNFDAYIDKANSYLNVILLLDVIMILSLVFGTLFVLGLTKRQHERASMRSQPSEVDIEPAYEDEAIAEEV